MSDKKIIAIVLVIIVILLIAIGGRNIIENVDAESIVVIQNIATGKLSVYNTPGPKWQGLGKVTVYKKSFQYWFSESKDQGEKIDQSVKLRFNDGGHGFISGSVRIDLPIDYDSMVLLHTKYGSQNAIDHELIRPAFEKSIYMSGPLMSSKESYAEKRNQLIEFIEDQAIRGVYQTSVKEVKRKDPTTGVEKTIMEVKIIEDANAPLKRARTEQSLFTLFNIKAYGLSINSIKYENTIERQIVKQQMMIMSVQTAMAEAKEAEQRTITAQKNGEANAAKEKWIQEAIKAKEVTLANQLKEVAEIEANKQLEVAKIQKSAAEMQKQREILLGEGEATRKKLIIEADGALQQKLSTYENVMKSFAEQMGKQKLVPDIMFGQSNGSVGAVNFMDLLTAKAAKDLSLDLSVPTQTVPVTK